ncbi:hypothetical protein CWI39_1805p0010 [Hamiltosporidium magnivora]|uniref:DUF2415 domain-containing protein n=1 Tax=Hamiltosporidium magnivora TaxID=148818 RepID=A0A4Q9L0K2_9MICR|nr:hypothetical protein CWI39_1805p0010 [Hamiltosporidium magnivora]
MTFQNLKEINNMLNPGYKTHNISVSIQHWQLRDMLKIHENNLIFAQGDKICGYNPDTKESSIFTENLGFYPTSLCCDHGYLAVGGQKSQLCIVELQSKKTFSTNLQGSINNAVQIYNHNGELRLMVCNNDHTIKVINLSNNENICNISHPFPVNNCQISNDGKLLASVGDTNDVYLYAIEDNNYRLIHNFKLINDGGFKVTWNTTSNLFSVATQDGYICVYDVRNLEKIHVIPTKQTPGLKGACRTVMFNRKRSLDILFYTEHMSSFGIIDTRTFSKRQTVLLSQADRDTQISGAVFSECNERIFVAVDDKILEYTINTPSRRVSSDYSIN